MDKRKDINADFKIVRFTRRAQPKGLFLGVVPAKSNGLAGVQFVTKIEFEDDLETAVNELEGRFNAAQFEPEKEEEKKAVEEVIEEVVEEVVEVTIEVTEEVVEEAIKVPVEPIEPKEVKRPSVKPARAKAAKGKASKKQ